MKTYISFLLFAVSIDAQYAGKSSKASSYSYSFSDLGKSGKSGRVLINVDEIEARTLHEGHDGMSYRMFVPSAKALKSSPKSGKAISYDEGEQMSYPMLSAKSTKFLTERSADSGKSAKIAAGDDQMSTKASKSVDNIFGRLLVDFEDSMSYPNIIVAGKSTKLKPKSSKKKTLTFVNASETKSSKAGKSKNIEVRAMDPTGTASLNAIDFTKMAAPETLSATAASREEASSSFIITNGLFTSCVLVVSYFMF